MTELVADMVKDVPAERPTMDEVVARYKQLIASLHWWTLRRPIDRRIYPMFLRMIRMAPIAVRGVHRILSGIRAIPVYTDA